MNALARLVDADAIRRLVDRDPTLFSSDVDQRQPIIQRLGWTDLADKAEGRLPLVENLAKALIDEGATDIVLLGMGGSSLAPIVLLRMIGAAPGMPRLHVLDTTCPSTVLELKNRLDPASTYFVVASKSGTTIEPLSLYAIFREWMDEHLERVPAGKHFIAITDPGSELEKMRQRQVMRVALSAPPTVGGRFSALSMFGLAPAALMGIDLRSFIATALPMERECQSADENTNPGALLASWIVDSLELGRDKLTVVTSPAYSSFGLWVEQLVAESTGKSGIGVIPVLENPPVDVLHYGPDRAVVVLRKSVDSDLETFAARAREAGHPVVEFTLDDPLGIGAEFVRWEYAIALVGHLLGINPFDEPNVAEAKQATTAVLDGTGGAPRAIADIGGVWPGYSDAMGVGAAPTSLEDALGAVRAALRPGDYLAILAYVPERDEHLSPLYDAAGLVSAGTGNAVCVELGPRYLHSTGQLHKGGPDTGVFLIITTRDAANLAIPGQPFSLGQLYRAQAEGDFVTLAAHGRRVARMDLPDNDPATLRALAEALAAGA